MHELAITENILKIALDAAKQNDLPKVLAVNLVMGEFSDIVPRILREIFCELSRGTAAENAEIRIEKTSVKIRCLSCGEENPIERDKIYCPVCKSTEIKMIAGREFFVKSIEAE